MKAGLLKGLTVLAVAVALATSAWAGTGYPGTVVMVDAAAGKLAVKKTGGGSRFTFVVTDKTRFVGLGGLKDLAKGDLVTVTYEVRGSQYLADTIAKR